MKRLINEPLSKHTTFRIGGPAAELVIPDNEDELIQEIKRCQQNEVKYRMLGKGSNLLITDKGIQDVIVKNTYACTCIEKNKNHVYAGSSISLQEFVNFCVRNDLEGMEYLYSIPGTIGGAIFMNAGRGRKKHQAISDKVDWVRYFNGQEVKILKKDECQFDFRKSIFHTKRNWVILGASFNLESQQKEIGERKIRERIDLVTKTQNRVYPNAGTIFKNTSYLSSFIMRGLKIGRAKMEKNWIINLGEATFNDVNNLIKVSICLNYLSLNKPELEIEIWK